MHNGNAIGEIRLTARDNLINHFIWLSFAVLTGYCILFLLLPSPLPYTISHHGMVVALQNITDVVHDVRTNRNLFLPG